VGVAALIVAEHGERDRRNGGLTMRPDRVQLVLERTATDTPCPPGGVQTYPGVPTPPDWTATCEGTPEFNGFYGEGVVDALTAVRRGGH
jgi:hypothetical protein